MARLIKRLTAKKVEHARKPGYYPDGANLYLQVSSSGSKSWIFRYATKGREREMGLGSLIAVPLTKAREKAGEARDKLAEGRDPLEDKSEADAQATLAKARSKTFAECAKSYITAHKTGWKNEK